MEETLHISRHSAQPAIRFGDFKLDLAEETLWRGDEKLNINPRMFQVLRLLVERRGEIVSKEEFFEKVWGGSFVEDNNLSVTITALRKALGDSAKDAKFIETVPRKGYRLIAELTKTADERTGERPETTEAKALSSAQPSKRGERSRSIGFVVLVVAVLMLAGAAAIGYRQGASAPAAGRYRFDSLAIIPFAGDPGSEYVAEGVTDDLTEKLSRIQGVRIIGKQYTSAYRIDPFDAAAAGRGLNASAVLTGRVAIENGSLTVVTELYDVAAGTLIWSRELRGRVGELIGLQNELSDAVVQAAFPESAANGVRRSSRGGTVNSEAYDLFIKGRHHWNKRADTSIELSIEFFRAAIDKDPTFAKAYVALANAYSTANLERSGITTAERINMARGAIERALEIDPELGEAYSARAINRCYIDWDLLGAESDYRKALELSPNDATILHWYAELLSMLGRFDESRALYERAMAADPLSFPIKTDYALSYYYSRDYDKAIELLNKARLLNPEYGRTYEFLSFAYREKGMYAEATESLRSRFELSLKNGDVTEEEYLEVTQALGRMQNSLERGSEGFWQGTRWDDANDPYFTAVAFAKLGDKDKAFEYLERAFDTRYTGMVWLKVTPDLDNLRPDPRFDDLLKRVGLP